MARLVHLCRFDDAGSLQLQVGDLDHDSYYAISHVWQQAVWTQIRGVERPVVASSQKVRFITDVLPSLVGHELFWMDILAVDQTSKEERSAIIQHIPTIYRNARKTIVIREDGGFQACCVDAVSRYISMYQTGQYPDRGTVWITEHVDEHHSGAFEESWLDRIWPMQETNLSDSLQFVTCRRIEAERNAPESGRIPDQIDPLPLHKMQNLTSIYEDLRIQAEAWVRRASFSVADADHGDQTAAEDGLVQNFMRAVVLDGAVERQPVFQESPQSIRSVLRHWRRSQRRTTESRDFVLAVFVEYSWYIVPENAKSLSFDRILADLAAQLPSSERLCARICGGSLQTKTSFEDAWQPSESAPDPLNLGEFVQLFCAIGDHDNVLRSELGWDLSAVTGEEPWEVILDAASSTFLMLDPQVLTDWQFGYHQWQMTVPPIRAILRHLGFAPGSEAPDSHDGKWAALRQQQEIISVLEAESSGGIVETLGALYFRLQGAPRAFGVDFMRSADASGLPRPDYRLSLTEMTARITSDWHLLVEILHQNRTREAREWTWYLLALASCGLPFRSLEWVKRNLRPYVLTARQSAFCPNTGKNERFKILTLAPPGLDPKQVMVINMYAKGAPVVELRETVGESEVRTALGLVPFLSLKATQGYTIFRDRARPIIWPVTAPAILEDENQAEQTYHLLRHVDAYFSKQGLWGIPSVENNPHDGPDDSGEVGSLFPHELRYGMLNVPLARISEAETSRGDPYAHDTDTITPSSFNDRIRYYSIVQSELY